MKLVTVLLVCVLASHSAFSQSTESLEDAIKRLETEIGREFDASKKKPRKVFVSARNTNDIVAAYVDVCLRKIESTGNRNYPLEARNTVYGNVIISFEVLATGEVESVSIERSSGHKILDYAAVRSVKLSSPLPPFPEELKKRVDIVVVTRSFRYVAADKAMDIVKD